MRRIFAFILTLTIVFSNVNLVSAESYVKVTDPCMARVVQVLDGETIKVSIQETNKLALVQLACIDTKSFNEAFSYLNSQLLGKNVYISPETKIANPSPRFNYMYVSLDGKLMNSDLLKKGFAKLNPKHSSATHYKSFLEDQEIGKTNELGQWEIEIGDTRAPFLGNGININTATAAQIFKVFRGMGENIPQRIVNYRENNPFDSMLELKFVAGITKEIFDMNRSYVAVSTNVNTASIEELCSLEDITEPKARNIVRYREEKGSFTKKSSLNDIMYFEDGLYQLNFDYFDIVNRSVVNITKPNRSANINTANKAQLVSAGLTEAQAESLMEVRGKYTFKSLEDLMSCHGLLFTKIQIDKLEDNLKAMTNLNTATELEIKSLFAGNNDKAAEKIYKNRPYVDVDDLLKQIDQATYDKISRFAYLVDYTNDRTNINTATEEQLKKVGFTEQQVTGLKNWRKFTDWSKVPIDVSKFDDKITLYTNINNCTVNELKTLTDLMTNQLAQTIVDYRTDQPFGSLEEVKEFLKSKEASNVASAISKYIVLR